MKCLYGKEYNLPEIDSFLLEGFSLEDFASVCNCGKCYVFIEDGEVKFVSIEETNRMMYELANKILNKQLGVKDES